MISIKRYFTLTPDELEKALQAVHLLIKGMGKYAIEAEKAEFDQFQEEMESYASQVQGPDPEQDLLVTSGAVLKTIEAYHRRTSALIRAQSTELQSIVTMLSDTIVKIGGANEDTTSRLRDLEKQLVQASAVDDVRTLKACMADCLQSVRDEMESNRSQAAQTIHTLQSQLDGTSERLEGAHPPAGRDPVTNLPNASAAEAALAIAAQEPSKHFVAVFVVNRVQLINARFGHAVGDEIMNVARDHLAGNLADPLFRWRGPSLMMLLQRSAQLEEVRMSLHRIASCKLQKNVDLGSRSALLPVTLAWTVFPMQPSARLIAQKADAFVAAQLPTE
jgi:GGDEF domain-containing protein